MSLETSRGKEKVRQPCEVFKVSSQGCYHSKHRPGCVVDGHPSWGVRLEHQDDLASIVPVVDCWDRYVLACELSKSQEASVGSFPPEKALRRAVGTGD